MTKVICTCDRCGKEFPAEKARTVRFVKPDRARKMIRRDHEPVSGGIFRDLSGWIMDMNWYTPKEFCPDCIEEIKEFINQKGD